VFDTCVAKAHCGSSKSFPSWFTANIIKMIKCKWQLWRSYKKNQSITIYNKFKTIRAEVKKKVNAAHIDYLKQVENDIKMDPKKCWSFLSNIKVTSGIPSQLVFNGETLSTPIKIVDAFAERFNVNYIKSNSSPSLTDNLIYHIISFGSVSEDQVLSALKKIKPKSTTGPDGIPAFLLPNCAATLAFPLSFLTLH
jgi:hypothetical protein